MRRFLAEAGALHALYLAFWMFLPDRYRPVTERWVTLVAMVLLLFYFLGLMIAFVWARKERLNYAFAIQKAYWALVVIGLALPTQGGLIVHHAPYFSNPYALWQTPGWFRTYTWVFLSLATAVVAREFVRANELRPSDPLRRAWRWGRDRFGGGDRGRSRRKGET